MTSNKFAQEQSNDLFLKDKEIPSTISSFFVKDHEDKYIIEFWNPQKDFHLFMPLEEDFERMEKDPEKYKDIISVFKKYRGGQKRVKVSESEILDKFLISPVLNVDKYINYFTDIKERSCYCRLRNVEVDMPKDKIFFDKETNQDISIKMFQTVEIEIRRLFNTPAKRDELRSIFHKDLVSNLNKMEDCNWAILLLKQLSL